MTHRFEPLEVGGGEVGSLIRTMNWDATPLGPLDSWPQHLRIPVGMMLSSRFAMWMGWGPELTFLYNDAYARMTLGKKHPWALGKPAHEVWAEIWRDLEPRVSTVFKTGTATWDEALPLILERSGYSEETYHTFSYSPLPDPDGGVAGMLCVVVEETDRVIGERKLAALRTLAADLATTTTEQEVLDAVERSLDTDAQDLPFTAVYLFDEDGKRLASRARPGSSEGRHFPPTSIDVGDGGRTLAARADRGRTPHHPDRRARRRSSLRKVRRYPGRGTGRRATPSSCRLRSAGKTARRGSSSPARIRIVSSIRHTKGSSS